MRLFGITSHKNSHKKKDKTMNEISVQLSKKMFFSKKTQIRNDFCITITNGKTPDPQILNHFLEDPNARIPQISVLGLEKLFKDADSMKSFAEALNHKKSYWNISYNANGKVLIFELKKKKFYSDSFAVKNYEFTALSHSKFENDPQTIGVEIYFDNFDVIYPELASHIKEVDSTLAYETPYINEFKVEYLNKSVSAVFKGREVGFNWNVGPSEKDVDVSLYDETGTFIGNVASQSKATVDGDKKFTLKVKKDGYEVSKTLDVKAVYIEELSLHDFNDQPALAIHKGDKAKILWSVKNSECASVSLQDEFGTLVTESPYIVRIDQDKTFTLKIELNGDVAFRKLDVHKTNWKKISDNVNIPFKPKDNEEHRISRGIDGYYTYVHPKIYNSVNLTEWKEIAEFKQAPENFKYVAHECYFYSPNQKLGIGYSSDQLGIGISYTCKDVNILTWYLEKPQWWNADKEPKQIYEEKDEWLACLYGSDEYDSYGIHVCERTIHVYALWHNPWCKMCTINIPDNAKALSVSMIDNHFCTVDERFLAVLCDNNHVYVYNVKDGSIHSFEFDRTDQKKVFIVKTNSIYVLLDNYVFELNGNKDLSETGFSPIDTIAKKDEAFMFVGEYDNSRFAAIVGDNDKATLWYYEP